MASSHDHYAPHASADVSGGVITYGPETGVVDPLDNQVHQTFAVHWTNVDRSWREWGYHQPLYDTFSLYLFDRNDRGLGDFDFAFVYDGMEWDSIDTSAEIYGDTGPDCNDGYTARAGFSNGTGIPGTFYELPGSGERGGLLDTISSLPNRTFSYAVHNPSAHFELLDTSPLGGKTSDTNKGVLGVVANGTNAGQLAIHLLSPGDNAYNYVYTVYDSADNIVGPAHQPFTTANTNFSVSTPGLYTVKVTCSNYPGYFEESAQFYFAHLNITWAGEDLTYGTGSTATNLTTGTFMTGHTFDLYSGQCVRLSYETDAYIPFPQAYQQWMAGDTKKWISNYQAGPESGHCKGMAPEDFLSTPFAGYRADDVQGLEMKLLIAFRVNGNVVKCYASTTLNIHKPGQSIWNGPCTIPGGPWPDLFTITGKFDPTRIRGGTSSNDKFYGSAVWNTSTPLDPDACDISFVQLVNGWDYYRYNYSPVQQSPDTTNGQYWLDNDYPYPGFTAAFPGGPHWRGYDSPSIEVTGYLGAAKLGLNWCFEDWLMWRPPGTNSISIPIQTWSWYAWGHADWDGARWSVYSVFAGTAFHGVDTCEFPEWQHHLYIP
jgi:hypothetical protein